MPCLIRQGPFRTSTCRLLPGSSTRIVFLDRNAIFRCLSSTPTRQATHGAQGRANGPKNGAGKRLGAKKTGDEYVIPGNIIFRQRGTHWFPGDNVGMGRDHTIFALQPGYVKYYRNPSLHPKRQYIGIVFDKTQTLPAPENAARRRRLGMTTTSRQDMVIDDSVGSDGAGGIGILRPSPDIPARKSAVGGADISPKLSKRTKREVRRKQATGRLAVDELHIRPDYSYRESNWQIGRAPERAGVKEQQFRKGDRFLAWRLRSARIRRNAEKRTVSKKKSTKQNRGGGSRQSQ